MLSALRGGYYEDGFRLFRVESISRDGVVLEDCFTNSYLAVDLGEFAAMNLRRVKCAAADAVAERNSTDAEPATS